jgi:Zn-dependent M28 family amino/carboxypeptidase
MKLTLITLIALLTIVSCSKDEHNHKGWGQDTGAFAFTKAALESGDYKEANLNKLDYRYFKIDPAYLKVKLSKLSGALPVIINGKQELIKERSSLKGERLSVAYLTQEFKTLGLKTAVHEYGQGRLNFIAQINGADTSKTFIISAHTDTVGNAGANDDGSGVIAMLAIAKALRHEKLKYNLRFVGFTQEEKGLIGSKNYVRSIQNKKSIIGNIHMEMMATNSRKDGAFHAIDCDRAESTYLSSHLFSAIKALKINLKRIPACTTRSDHKNFWDAKIPSIVLSENFFGGDGDPCYHRKCDVVDKRLDFIYMANITAAVTSAVNTMLK